MKFTKLKPSKLKNPESQLNLKLTKTKQVNCNPNLANQIAIYHFNLIAAKQANYKSQFKSQPETLIKKT